MAKVKVLGQEFKAAPDKGPDGAKLGVSVVEITDATSSSLGLPKETYDARIVLDDGQTMPAFYLGGGGPQDQINIDGATVGDRYVIASTHNAFGGFTEEGQ